MFDICSIDFRYMFHVQYCDPLRPATAPYDPRRPVTTGDGSHVALTVRFHESMPRFNTPLNFERFGSHGSVHTVRKEIENRKSKLSRMCEFVYCLYAGPLCRMGQHNKDPLRTAKNR